MIEKAAAIDGSNYSIYTYRGLCHFHTNNYESAAADFQKSLELNSDAVENYYYMGLIFDNRKQYVKALEYYNAFFKLSPAGKNFKHKNCVIRRIKTLNNSLSAQ